MKKRNEVITEAWKEQAETRIKQTEATDEQIEATEAAATRKDKPGMEDKRPTDRDPLEPRENYNKTKSQNAK